MLPYFPQILVVRWNIIVHIHISLAVKTTVAAFIQFASVKRTYMNKSLHSALVEEAVPAFTIEYSSS